MDKICFKCQQCKPIDDFYKHKYMADGHLGKCKECTKADARANYRVDPIAHQNYERQRGKTPERRAKALEYQRTRRARKKLESRARNLVGHALRSGALVKEACTDCGTSDSIEAHHEDYNKPLDVVWLCFNCHRIRHNQTVLPVINLEAIGNKPPAE